MSDMLMQIALKIAIAHRAESKIVLLCVEKNLFR
jgi:hypothetical protein